MLVARRRDRTTHALPPFSIYLNEKPSGDSLISMPDGTSFHHIEKDPDDTVPGLARSLACSVVPVESVECSCLQEGLATMRRRETCRLLDRVIPHRDNSPTVLPVLYGFTDGARSVFFSADPAHLRDDRFDLLRKPGDFGLCRRSSTTPQG